jgi:Flp pilus assembly protein TadG
MAPSRTSRFSDESGFSMVFVGLGFMAFLSVSMLAIDVGMLMTARSQAQNSADAGALAGATALVFDNWDDRTPTGPAVQNAEKAALSNKVIAKDVSVQDGDVTFPTNPAGLANRVQVKVYRTAARFNPVATLIAAYFGTKTADITATAVAEASPANAETCVKPFTIPDRWQENTNPPWDPLNSTYDYYDKKGNVLASHDTYIPVGQPGYTGYSMTTDKGLMLEIRAGTGNNISPSFYFSWSMPAVTGGDPNTGAAWYRSNISGCNTSIQNVGGTMTQEPGNMEGPTVQGAQALMDQDPNATWDTSTNSLHSNMHPSPRVFPIPLYDPQYYADGKANGRNASLKAANWIGFFIDHIDGNNIYGRITPIPGILDAGAGPAPEGVNPYSIRLVK